MLFDFKDWNCSSLSAYMVNLNGRICNQDFVECISTIYKKDETYFIISNMMESVIAKTIAKNKVINIAKKEFPNNYTKWFPVEKW